MQQGHRSVCPDHPAFATAMAFQPIMDGETERPIAHQALVRGGKGEGARDSLRGSAQRTAIISTSDAASPRFRAPWPRDGSHPIRGCRSISFPTPFTRHWPAWSRFSTPRGG
ncbi:hypothetical protein NZL82_17220 [Sphingomonas sanguinis]|uniref:hypothetical protein n=1 Tax=Sphingomonas sp. LC-1 TaxID=3110957 RepID=UPI0021BB86E7|nr:hypothetical protein [Sphingomonas sp. LC-1]MCT8003617.1 hypothetical protein [Sphingomonas sp. LC-1]